MWRSGFSSGADQPLGPVRRPDRGDPSTGLPGEMRLIAMQNTRCASSANTTSNQDNAVLAASTYRTCSTLATRSPGAG